MALYVEFVQTILKRLHSYLTMVDNNMKKVYNLGFLLSQTPDKMCY